jgi:predicted protein tyrosine phosphatase
MEKLHRKRSRKCHRKRVKNRRVINVVINGSIFIKIEYVGDANLDAKRQ